MIKKHFFSAILGLTVLILLAQPQYDVTILYVDNTPVPVVIDGLDNDSCWNNARWHNIDKVWIPYGATMQTCRRVILKDIIRLPGTQTICTCLLK